MPESEMFDVAIIGGGPGGSTTGALLRKYNPALRVCILEREVFPREHVGESQLPGTCAVLHEMGCWDKIEAEGFPVKVGATYTWGKTTDPWRFEFIPNGEIPAEARRPAKYEGWRTGTAFQVDRAIYDKVLLDHAQELGCEVRQGTRVAAIPHTGDRVDGLQLESGEVVRAKHYVDASGNVAILRRALGVECDVPTLLKNVAFWDYWENPGWASEQGAAATRVHIRSIGFGWVWFIPLSATRASVGLVVPGDFYKSCGKKPAELYAEAMGAEKLVAQRLEGATRENNVRTTTDWSFVVDRTYGENWFLVGEVAGFADPILSAGLTLTHTGARELAYMLLELERGELDPAWLKDRYNDLQTRRVRQHMKFAEYWYSANGMFENIREHCSQIAEEAGLRFNPADAFRWLSQGGLGDDFPGQVGIGGHDLASMRQILARFGGQKAEWTINGKNVFKLNLTGAKEELIGIPRDGRITQSRCYVRGGRRLACIGIQGMLIESLKSFSDIEFIISDLKARASLEFGHLEWDWVYKTAIQVLEVMANDYWVISSTKKGKPTLNVHSPEEGVYIFTERASA